MGVFISIEIDTKNIPIQTVKTIISLCPVDIYKEEDRQMIVRSELEDECTLCERCLESAPRGTIHIRKTYKNEVLVSRGLNELTFKG